VAAVVVTVQEVKVQADLVVAVVADLVAGPLREPLTQAVAAAEMAILVLVSRAAAVL
jgi:hypothetical protein